jgi:hypothetical protein
MYAGFGDACSINLDVGKFMDILRTNGSVIMNGERIYYHEHVTDYLANGYWR